MDCKGNGTISPGANVGYAVLDNTLVVCDGVGSTRYSTDGTLIYLYRVSSYSYFSEQYQNRIYAAGTASDLVLFNYRGCQLTGQTFGDFQTPLHSRYLELES